MIAWIPRRQGATLPLVACLALAAACGGDRTDADTTATLDSAALAPTTGAVGSTMTDQQIVTQISAANAAEIATNQLATDKATAADVKSFAGKMIEDHQRFQGQVDSLATRLNIPAQPAASDSLQEAFDRRRDALKGRAAGAEWDRDFMDLQVRMHEATLDLLNRSVSSAQNTELRDAAQQAVPVVQGHLDQARQILNGLGGALPDSGTGM